MTEVDPGLLRGSLHVYRGKTTGGGLKAVVYPLIEMEENNLK